MTNILNPMMLGCALFVCQAAMAGPVELSADNQGQALIVPLWTVEAGNDTLVTVRNNSDWAVAVKVRILDKHGGEFTAFNLYLNDDDSWNVASTASGNGTVLLTNYESFMLTAQAMVAPIRIGAASHWDQ